MNIFFLSLNPIENAYLLCDQHVVKLILEVCQMLWTAYHVLNSDIKDLQQIVNESHLSLIKVYRPTHINHPINVWVRKNLSNYIWTTTFFGALLQEYFRRYGKYHACYNSYFWFISHQPRFSSLTCYVNHPQLAEKDFPMNCSPPPLCMPEEYWKEKSLLQSYYRYYLKEKLKFARWKLGKPSMFVEN